MLWNRRIIIVNPKDMRFQNYKSKENKKSRINYIFANLFSWEFFILNPFPSLLIISYEERKEVGRSSSGDS